MNTPTLGQDYRTGTIRTSGYTPNTSGYAPTGQTSFETTYRTEPTPTIPTATIDPLFFASNLQKRLMREGGARNVFNPIFPQTPGSITPHPTSSLTTDKLQIPSELRAEESSNIGGQILKWGLIGGGVIAAAVMLKG